MRDNMSNNKRIARNTVMLYVRMFFSILVSLYTSRVVLQTLGVEDYGLYSVVGGVVSMFVFLNTSMSAATSRFLTFEMGRGDCNSLSTVFSSALIVHIIISIIILVIAETVGLWFLCNKMVIPEGRMFAAHIVYQCSILSMIITVTQVPYNASIIAHEQMDIYAFVGILEVFLKLVIVFLLLIGSFDKLIFYSILVLIVTLVIAFIYRIYCIKHYEETRFKFVWEKNVIKHLLSFSNIVLNMFFGTIVNAAGGIASTVQGILTGFFGNVVTAVRPQIIMSYSVGDLDRMNRLIRTSIRLNLFLASLVIVPSIIETEFILNLWLGANPAYSVVFTRLLLFVLYVTAVSQILTIGIQASGDIRQTSLVRSIFYTLTPIVIYFSLLYFNISPTHCYVILVSIQTLVCLIDIYILHIKIPQIDCLKIFMDYLFVMLTSCLLCFVGIIYRQDTAVGIINSIFMIITSILIVALFYYFFLFSTDERQMAKSMILNYYQKCR